MIKMYRYESLKRIKLDKLIPAFIMMAVCWALVALGVDNFSTWFDSGIVDLSCGTGPNVYFAFRYIGNGNSGFDGTYELDNIKITAN